MYGVTYFAWIILFAILRFSSVSSYSGLCDRNICHRYVNGHWIYAHNIGCNNPDTYSYSCPMSAAIQPMSNKIRKYILHLHNHKRNYIANGWVSDFQEAERMATLQWDYELEYLAQLNTLRCYYGPDACRNTQTFPHVGQNIDLYWTSKGFLSNKALIKRIFDVWYDEYRLTPRSVINSYHPTGQLIGHFTQIVSGKSAAIGCALIHWKKWHWDHNRYYMYFVCNYSYTNYVGQPVYKTGYVGSKCKTGTNRKYTGLCSTREVFYPVPIVGSGSSSSYGGYSVPSTQYSSSSSDNRQRSSGSTSATVLYSSSQSGTSSYSSTSYHSSWSTSSSSTTYYS